MNVATAMAKSIFFPGNLKRENPYPTTDAEIVCKSAGIVEIMIVCVNVFT